MSGSAKLAPWPYSGKLAGVGIMLKTDPQTGRQMSSPKVQPFENVIGQDYNYSSVPPFYERAYPFRRLIKGMGEAVQQFANVARYYYADGVDCSINGMPMLALELNTVTPTNTGPVMGFVEANLDYGVGSLGGKTIGELAPYSIGGLSAFTIGAPATAKLLAMCGQYVNVRNADTNVEWALSKDLGAGVTVQSAQRFKNNIDNAPTVTGGAIAERVYFTTDQGHFWQFTGETDTGDWTDLTTSLPALTPSAYYLEMNNDLLIRSAGANLISTCAADPAVADNWSGPVFVGDAAAQITWLRVLNGVLYIFKTNGVFDIDANGEPRDLFPALRITVNRRNGRNAANWQNQAWFNYGDSFWSLGPNSQGIVEANPVGVERFIENMAGVRGYVAASDGWSSWYNFLGLYNEETNTSYLLKLGSWFVDDRAPLGTPVGKEGSFFDPALHGALASFPGKRITAMKVSSLPGPNERLYIGFSDGSISWGILPRGTPNPLADANCRFQTSGHVRFGSHSMNYPANKKSFRGATMLGPRLDLENTATISWQVTPSRGKTIGDLAAYTIGGLSAFTIGDLGSGDFETLGTFTSPAQRIDLVRADGTSGAVGTAIDVDLALAGDGSSSPWIEGFALHEMLRPDLLLEREFTVKAGDKITRRDGTQDWRTADQIRAVVQSAADAKGVVPFQMEDGKTVQVEVIDYNEHLASEQNRFGNAWDIDIKAVEFASTVQFGSIGRLSGYTIGDLRQFRIGQLGGL